MQGKTKDKREATSQAAHTAGAYPGFRSIKRLGIFLLPLNGMLVHRRLPPSIMFPVPTWVERGTSRVNCLALEHNTSDPGRGSNSDRSIRSPAH